MSQCMGTSSEIPWSWCFTLFTPSFLSGNGTSGIKIYTYLTCLSITVVCYPKFYLVQIVQLKPSNQKISQCSLATHVYATTNAFSLSNQFSLCNTFLLS